MIFLLNYLPVLLLIVGGLITFHFISKGKRKAAVISFFGSVVLVFGYSAFAPSYMPKGSVYKPAVAEFEVSESEVQDRLRIARTEEEHSDRLNEGLDWKEKAERSKQEAEGLKDTKTE